LPGIAPADHGGRACRSTGWDMTAGECAGDSERELRDWARATPPPEPAPPDDWSMATLPELVQDIIASHHASLRRELRRMDVLIRHLCQRHGGLGHLGLEGAFRRFADDMIAHLDHEEAVVFPLSIVIEHASRRLSETIPLDSDVTAAIRFMNMGHDDSADALQRLITMIGTTSQCIIDPDCALIGAGLSAMLADLAEHGNKEQGILMPAVIFAEEQIRARTGKHHAEGCVRAE
jgi:iron-sulfur cluster repair protein YtfE (RIC family)